jgi:hypothetical protein
LDVYFSMRDSGEHPMFMESLAGSRPSEFRPSTNHTYRLKFFDDAHGVAKYVEFEAEDASRALVIAQREARHRAAQLSRDGRTLCTIRRLEGDAWEISPVK